MGWDLSTASWGTLAVLLGGLTAVAVFRPWRFLRPRQHCPQCKQLLPRWDCWGWKDSWTCHRCGCQVGH
jgi:hypothetical protein